MATEKIAGLSQPKRDRLAFQKMRIGFIEESWRRDFVVPFETQPVAATRDFAVHGAPRPRNPYRCGSRSLYLVCIHGTDQQSHHFGAD